MGLPMLVKFGLLWMIHIMPQAVRTSSHCPPPSPFELIHSTFGVNTELSGLVELTCRNGVTAEKLPVSDIKVWLNRTSVHDPDLREREDVGDVEVHGCCSLRFNLTRELEGNFTCGKKIDAANVRESIPKTLISPQVLFPLTHEVQTTFIATSGDRSILKCPLKPGALLEHYSVMWMKGHVRIAEARNPHDVETIDSRYSIDSTSYSLIIDHTNSNDSSINYQCAIFATNPLTNTRRELRFFPEHNILLSLQVHEKPSISSGPTNIVECNPTEQPSFSCIAIGPNAPNITWTYISNGGEEIILTDGDNYRIESNVSQVEDGLYAINSTITFLNVASNESAIVRCKIDVPGAASADAILVTIDCSTNNKDVALNVQLIALAVSILAAIGIGLILIVVTCVYCIHVHRKHKKSLELCS